MPEASSAGARAPHDVRRRPVVFAVPGDLERPTGGYAYARHLLAELPRLGVPISHLALPGGFPFPDPNDLAETEQLIYGIPHDAVLLVDGLAYGAFPRALAARIPQTIVALVHHPLAIEHGLGEAAAARLLASERAALAHADGVIAASAETARRLAADYAVPINRIVIAEPGTDPAERARGSEANGGECGPVALISVGAVSPRKGYDLLIDALARLADAPWRLTIVGSLEHDVGTADQLRAQIASQGLAHRVTLTGAICKDARDRLLAISDLFVMASHHEGYGMVLAEAMARGLAIVTTRAGAAAETVPDGAALKVACGDVGGLAAALERAISSRDLRQELAAASWDAGQRLPTWTDTARRVVAGLERATP